MFLKTLEWEPDDDPGQTFRARRPSPFGARKKRAAGGGARKAIPRHYHRQTHFVTSTLNRCEPG